MSVNRRKQVRCSMCTPFRWLGNRSARWKHSDQIRASAADAQVDEINGKEKKTPHRSARKPKTQKPKKVYRWQKSICPFCDGTLKITGQGRWRWNHKYAEECQCGARRVADCPCCHRPTWFKDGIYKHQWLGCGFVGRRLNTSPTSPDTKGGD